MRTRARLVTVWAGLFAVLLLPGASAAQSTCSQAPQPGLERYLRQLYLDLLGRPPTIEQYEAARAKGRVDLDDLRALMTEEDFFARIREYHRALFRSNVSASVYSEGDTRVSETSDSGNPALSGIRFYERGGGGAQQLRGRRDEGCNRFILQSDCNAQSEDPHLEPATKACFDAQGVPLPVSVDYDTRSQYYQCGSYDETAGNVFVSGRPINAVDTSVTSCTAAVGSGLIPDKYLYFCDMRRVSGELKPFLCLPNPANSFSAQLTEETVDAADGNRVVRFSHPTNANSYLARCTLELSNRGNVTGDYQSSQRGCIQREGYALVSPPYWELSPPTPQVATCAIDAQDRPANPFTLASCEARRFLGDRSCGCGAGFRRCEASDQNKVHRVRVEAINEEPLLIADSVVRRDEDYLNLLSTRRGYVNGPLADLYRGMQGTGVWNLTAPVDASALPDVDFQDGESSWVEYVRGAQHSGVLTTPSFLLRFPTQRSRVAQFYDAFLCKTFSPPADATLPPPEHSCNRENNLAKRCGCNYCHATLEPTGAHWGRFGERSAEFLAPDRFPRLDVKCRDCALAGDTNCGGECANYVMQAYDGDGANSLGLLRTYLYRTPEEEPNIEGGPALLVARMMQTGDLERCAVRRMWHHLLGRPMSAEEERLYLADLSRGFIEDGRKLKKLIERILDTDAYRRID